MKALEERPEPLDEAIDERATDLHAVEAQSGKKHLQ
jgi:hypothetical protein